jgi:RNA polymerase sigma-70 factor (ECF subfamily)
MVTTEFDATLAGARNGDDRAFAELWHAFHPPLRRYLRVVAPAMDADDLASITWIEVVRGLDRFTGGEDEFRAWLFTIARHRVYDQRRAASRRVHTSPIDDLAAPSDGGAGDPGRLTEEAAATEAALALLARLPAEQAEVVALRVIAGLDVAAVAELTGRKPGTVRVVAHRALKRLEALVQDSVRAGDGNGEWPGGA